MSIQPSFLFLICLENATSESNTFWSDRMRSTSNNHNSNKVFFLKTDCLSNDTRSLIPPRINITSIHFSYPYCYKQTGMISFRLSRENWQKESQELSYFDGSVPIEVIILPYDDNIRRDPSYKSKRILQEIIRSPRGLEVEFELTDILFKNNSLVYGFDSKHELVCEKPSDNEQSNRIEHFPPYGKLDESSPFVRIWYHDKKPNALVSSTDQFTFLCCGSQNKDILNFHALFSAFDATTSALVVLSLMIWPLFFCLLENKFEIRKVLLDFDGLVLGIITILEQGHRRMMNSKGKTALYILAASNMLVNIVLSNAFKGNNIQSVLAELNPIPYTRFDQLIDNSSDIFTLIIVKEFILYWGFVLTTEWEAGLESFPYQFNEPALSRINNSLRVHPVDLGWYVNQTNVTRASVLKKCNKTAVISWKSNLELIQKELVGVRNVFLGKEDIFTREMGIRIQHWFDPRVEDRLSRIRDSGIQHEWLTIFNKTIPPIPAQPQKASLQGNIVVEFSILGFGLCTAIIPFVVEMRKPITKFVKRMHKMSSILLRRQVEFLLRFLNALFCPHRFLK